MVGLVFGDSDAGGNPGMATMNDFPDAEYEAARLRVRCWFRDRILQSIASAESGPARPKKNKRTNPLERFPSPEKKTIFPVLRKVLTPQERPFRKLEAQRSRRRDIRQQRMPQSQQQRSA